MLGANFSALGARVEFGDMPTYGYRCVKGHEFEVIQAITESPLTKCEECGAAVKRIFYPVGIVFKGTGFYKTDSRGKSSSAVPGAASDSGPGSAAAPAAASAESSSSDSSPGAEAKPDKPATAAKKGAKPAKSSPA